MYRILLFGAGAYYRDHRDIIARLLNTEILGFIDNDQKKQGTSVDGHLIYGLDEAKGLPYDYIVLMSIYACEMEKQLWEHGVKKRRIYRLREYQGICNGERFIRYKSKYVRTQYDFKKAIIWITADIDINGGSIAAKYAMIALQEEGYRVTAAAAYGRKDCVEELINCGIDVILYPNIEFESYEKLPFLFDYDAVIVNTYQMYHCIYHIVDHMPVYWWIHESADMYENDMKIWGRPSGEVLKKAGIYAVSERARETFLSFFPDQNVRILEYGIPDMGAENEGRSAVNTNKIFAVIGNVCEIKGQDIFLEAVKLLGREAEGCEFWIIGKLFDNQYGSKILDTAERMNNVRIWGEVDHIALEKLYKKIDVVVVPSRMDSLPIVVTEALMYRRALILSTAVGTKEYLPKDAVLFFETGDAEMLADSMKRLLKNTGLIKKDAGRKVYEKYFSLSAVKVRLIKMLGE